MAEPGLARCIRLVFIDAIHVKIRDEQVVNRPIYVALAVMCEGRRTTQSRQCLLIITATWTGCRGGEIAALQGHNTHTDDRTIVIDPDIGAPKESSRR